MKMKKNAVIITGANVSQECVDKIEKWINDPTKKSLVLAPKTGFGKSVDVQFQEVSVNYGFFRSIWYKIMGS